jgi:hypothetical protein
MIDSKAVGTTSLQVTSRVKQPDTFANNSELQITYTLLWFRELTEAYGWLLKSQPPRGTQPVLSCGFGCRLRLRHQSAHEVLHKLYGQWSIVAKAFS